MCGVGAHQTKTIKISLNLAETREDESQNNSQRAQLLPTHCSINWIASDRWKRASRTRTRCGSYVTRIVSRFLISIIFNLNSLIEKFCPHFSYICLFTMAPLTLFQQQMLMFYHVVSHYGFLLFTVPSDDISKHNETSPQSLDYLTI